LLGLKSRRIAEYKQWLKCRPNGGTQGNTPPHLVTRKSDIAEKERIVSRCLE